MQHLQIPDVTSEADAKTIFLERTAEITGMSKFDNAEMHQIHMSTYHLEKAVAYYAENSEGAQKEAAEAIAVVVEDIHINSERFRSDETREHVKKLADLTDSFSASLE